MDDVTLFVECVHGYCDNWECKLWMIEDQERLMMVRVNKEQKISNHSAEKYGSYIMCNDHN